MGKQVTILNGFTNVRLPSTNGFEYYSSGQVATLTDAEYSALTTVVTRSFKGTPTTVADPARAATDPNSAAVTVNTTAGAAISLAPGVNRLTLTAVVTSIVVNGATAGTASFYDVFLTQGTGGTKSITWTGLTNFKVAGGTKPVLSTAAGTVDYLRLVTFDGGTTVYILASGLALA